MWCDITGSISPCEKAINICDKSNIKGKQTELAGVWMSGTTVVVDWFRWYIHPFRLRGQTETQRKQRKYTFCAFVTLNKCLIAFQLTFLNFSVFAQSHLGCFSFVARPQEKEVTLLSCLYYRVEQLILGPVYTWCEHIFCGHCNFWCSVVQWIKIVRNFCTKFNHKEVSHKRTK